MVNGRGAHQPNRLRRGRGWSRVVCVCGGWYLSAACAGGQDDLARVAPGPPVAERTETCVVSLGSTTPPTIIGVPDTVLSHRAPVPTNLAEKLTFRSAYQGLIQADCLGRPAPGVAESWRSSDGGRVWTFVLQRDLRFWDGMQVTARQIQAGWERTGLPGPVQVVETAGDRTLRIVLSDAVDTVSYFADDQFRVRSSLEMDGWPIGTAAWRPLRSTLGGTTQLVTTQSIPDTVSVVMVASRDGRDLLDRDASSALITSDPTVISYARAQAQALFSVVPLPWDRVYVLFHQQGDVGLPMDVRRSYAEDVVRTRAVAAEQPLWWATASCARVGDGVGVSPASRIAYHPLDLEGRRLADRIVSQLQSGDPTLSAALGRRGPDPTAVAFGLSASGVDAVLSGEALAAVVVLPYNSLTLCGADDVGRALTRGYAVPLVQVGATLIIPQGMGGFRIDWDGTPVLVRPMRSP